MKKLYFNITNIICEPELTSPDILNFAYSLFSKFNMKIINMFGKTIFVAFLTISINIQGQDDQSVFEEVNVTAEKRSESLQGVSQAVTALTSSEIEVKNQKDTLEDQARKAKSYSELVDKFKSLEKLFYKNRFRDLNNKLSKFLKEKEEFGNITNAVSYTHLTLPTIYSV